MAAAEPGTTIVAVPHADGTTGTVTLRAEADTGAFSEPWAITVDGTAVDIRIHTADDTPPVLFTCIPGAHITPAMLAAAGIHNATDIHTLTVTVA